MDTRHYQTMRYRKVKLIANGIACSKKKNNSMARWMALMSVLAMSTANKYPRGVYFDTDSVEVGIDNQCSACISYKAEAFLGELKPTVRTIKGFGG